MIPTLQIVLIEMIPSKIGGLRISQTILVLVTVLTLRLTSWSRLTKMHLHSRIVYLLLLHIFACNDCKRLHPWVAWFLVLVCCGKGSTFLTIPVSPVGCCMLVCLCFAKGFPCILWHTSVSKCMPLHPFMHHSLTFISVDKSFPKNCFACYQLE